MATAQFDAREFRRVLGAFVTGVTVVTTVDASGRRFGLTANSFTSVSLDPPLILWSQSTTAPSHPAFESADRFAVNILSEEQIEISNRFAGKAADDKFAGVSWRPGLGNVPLLDDCLAVIECRKEATYPGGDHKLFVGRVERIDIASGKGLLFGHGRYLLAHPHDLGLEQDTGRPADVRAARLAAPLLDELAVEHGVAMGMAVWGNHGPTIIHWTEQSGAVVGKVRIGSVIPVLTSACGRAFAAFRPRQSSAAAISAELELERVGEGPERTRVTCAVEAMIAETRSAGFAQISNSPSFEELYGGDISAVAAPVFDANGAMVMAVTAAAPADVMDDARQHTLAAVLLSLAAKVSRGLGYDPAAFAVGHGIASVADGGH